MKLRDCQEPPLTPTRYAAGLFQCVCYDPSPFLFVVDFVHATSVLAVLACGRHTRTSPGCVLSAHVVF